MPGPGLRMLARVTFDDPAVRLVLLALATGALAGALGSWIVLRRQAFLAHASGATAFAGGSVAFSLGACGLFFGFVAIELGLLPESLMQALPLRIFGIMQNETLLAIPFFTLMGLILERSGMAEDLLDTIGQVFGPIRGGVALAESTGKSRG